MPKLMSNSESSTEPIVLHDGAAVLLAGSAQLGQPEGVAVMVGPHQVAADILPGT